MRAFENVDINICVTSILGKIWSLSRNIVCNAYKRCEILLSNSWQKNMVCVGGLYKVVGFSFDITNFGNYFS